MKNTGNIILIFIVFMLFFSCKKETEVLPVDITTKYYPNTEGRFVVYHIDSLYYNEFTSKIDTISFDIKEKIVEFFYDAGGRKTQRIQRYKKTNNGWEVIRVWKAYTNTKKVEKTEEDITYIKLIFPLQKNIDWYGNAMNTTDSTSKLKYKCIDLNVSFNNSKLQFDSCATILHESDSTLISKNETKEIYAIGVGLIYKRVTNLYDRTSQIDVTKTISKRANSGTDVIIYATDFGIE